MTEILSLRKQTRNFPKEFERKFFLFTRIKFRRRKLEKSISHAKISYLHEIFSRYVGWNLVR